jgi:uncharacterized membrane protein YeiB
MKNKIPLLFFILIYFNQGIFDLPSQAIYYLIKEQWCMGASMVGFCAFITGAAWYLKIFFGMLLDFKQLGKNSTRNYLTISYTFLLILYGYILFFGVNFLTLIITGLSIVV